MTAPVVTATGLTRSFHRGAAQVTAVRDLTLQVAAGEFLAVEGPSGAGKSTLLHLLAGLDTPDAGDIAVLGYRLHELDERRRAQLRRHHIGLILQRFDLLATLDAAENVAVAGILAGHSHRQAQVRAVELLASLGLEPRVQHRPGELSGGEQQRVAIARALYHQPELIIADEPTATLDTVTGDDILGILRQLSSDGHTVILATHSARASAHADRTLRLVDGRLVAGGSNP